MTAFNPNRKPSPDKAPARTTILHLAPDMEAGEPARELIDICLQTHRSGWRPLAATAGGPWVIEAERAAIRHTELPLRSGVFLRNLRARRIVGSLIERERPVLIHAHGFETAGLAARLAYVKRLPFLIDLTSFAPVTSARRKILQLAANRGARFRVPSNAMMRHLREDFGLKTDYLYRVFPGIDTNWFDATRVTPERIRELSHVWRLPEQASIIVTATPFVPGGGHKELLDVVASLKHKDIYLVLIGDDKPVPGMRAEIEKMIEERGLEGRVIMPDNCNDWPAACWLSCLVVALNAVPRGQASELLAAQALGRPVIVTDCGANAELVKKNETAWVVPTENARALRKAFSEALSMGAARKIELAVKTRAFVSDFFPMEIWRDSIFEIYDAMLCQPMFLDREAE